MDQNRGREILRSLFKEEKFAYFCENCCFTKACPIKNTLDCPLKKRNSCLAKMELTECGFNKREGCLRKRQ